MSNPRKSTPSYLPHTQSGRARAVWTDALGVRQQRLLPGPFDSPESRTAFAKLHLELAATPFQSSTSTPATVSVNEVLLAYLDHAERHYRRADGTMTHEVDEPPDLPVRPRAVRHHPGRRVRPAGAQGGTAEVHFRRLVPVACQPAGRPRPPGVQVGGERATGAGRGVPGAGHRAGATAGAVVGAGVEAGQAGGGCGGGRHLAVPQPARPRAGRVPAVDRVPTRGGVRPAVVRPGHGRGGVGVPPAAPQDGVAGEGPRHPRRAEGARPVAKVPAGRPRRPGVLPVAGGGRVPRRARGEPKDPAVYPSHLARNATKRKKNPKRVPAAGYTASSYGHAVVRACDKAFPPPAPLARREDEMEAKWWARLTDEQKREVEGWRKAHRWHPNQLRHTFATAVRKGHGLEAAQALLGHAQADVTQVYAVRNEELACEVAELIG